MKSKPCHEYKGKRIGGFRVCCKGKLVRSPHHSIVYFTSLLIISPCIVQVILGNTCFPSVAAQAVVGIIYLISLLVDLWILMQTSLSDPGIIPRGDPAQLQEMEPTRINSEVKEQYVIVKGVEIYIGKCYTCGIRKPPRSFHCSYCDACIEVHDHHCPWVGTCIGKRNHKYFVMFLLYTSFQGFFTAVIDIVIIAKGYDQKLITLQDNIPVWVLLIYSGMFGVSLFFFGLYQLVLVSRGRTTNEDVRGKYRKYKGNPFDKGFKRNCQYFWRTKSSKVVDVKTIAQDDEFEIHERAREADPVDMMEQ